MFPLFCDWALVSTSEQGDQSFVQEESREQSADGTIPSLQTKTPCGMNMLVWCLEHWAEGDQGELSALDYYFT